MSTKESKDVLRLPGGANTILSGRPIYMTRFSSTPRGVMETRSQQSIVTIKPNSIGR